MPDDQKKAGPKNTLGDLNNHLFAELERLDDESLKGDALQEDVTGPRRFRG